MPEKDLYSILGLSRDAGQEEIKKAYRRLARQYHPDVNNGDDGASEQFKKVKHAYDILSDTQKRARYDRYGETDDSQAGFGGFSGFGGGEGFGFDDIFESFFGGGFGQSRSSNGPRRGSDLRYDLEITLEEAFSGVDRVITIPRTERCQSCDGTGAKKGSSVETCSNCRGSGQEQIVRNTAYGRFVNVQTCSHCNGEGKFIKNPCPDCYGKGQSVKERKVDFKIPPGVDSDTRMRLSGEGESGTRGGPPGDLFIYLKVKPHKLFRRDGNTLLYDLTLSIAKATLGADVDIPTLDGEAALHIPEGSQPETVFRLKGKGMPQVRGFGRGDMKVRLKVEIPRRLNKEQKEALAHFARLGGEEVSTDGKGIFSRVKEAFGGK